MFRRLRTVLLIVLGLLLQAPRCVRSDDGAQIHKDVAYGEDPKFQTLDLKLPAATGKPAPLVIWIHGGGWRSGDKRSPHPVSKLTDQGFAVASINYRLTTVAAYPAQLDDCQAAVRFLRGKAEEYGIDADRIGIWGGSAGGHLAAMLGVTSDDDENSVRVQAVCDWCGPTDLVRAVGEAPKDSPIEIGELLWGLVLGPNADNKRLRQSLNVEQRVRLLEAASPIRFVSGREPPFLVVHGDADTTVPIAQSRRFVAALRDAGVDVTFREVPDAGHRLLENRQCVAEAEDFFVRILQAAPPEPLKDGQTVRGTPATGGKRRAR